MGQCYSCIERSRLKPGLHGAFQSAVNAGRKVLLPTGYNLSVENDTVIDQLKYLFRFNAPLGGTIEADSQPGGTWLTVGNCFDQSYSWFGVILEWWDAVAPFLDVDSDMEIDVDEGVTLLYIGEDGKPRQDWCEHDEEEDE